MLMYYPSKVSNVYSLITPSEGGWLYLSTIAVVAAAVAVGHYC